ncbi:hypothetical protein PR202_gb20689 [Eleusine coracana subsp. coracana]|uniref:Uncharacterized protein n=1 Tax=Eleusine coracana subsp. coracana TaxID=191504 RepID=A0AAV5FD63_ELECO|nr:hypothetical protein PR202_gb20689 [Eleusine coracana subsp. coracana]
MHHARPGPLPGFHRLLRGGGLPRAPPPSPPRVRAHHLLPPGPARVLPRAARAAAARPGAAGGPGRPRRVAGVGHLGDASHHVRVARGRADAGAGAEDGRVGGRHRGHWDRLLLPVLRHRRRVLRRGARPSAGDGRARAVPRREGLILMACMSQQ